MLVKNKIFITNQITNLKKPIVMWKVNWVKKSIDGDR